jgi:hypothetical protein
VSNGQRPRALLGGEFRNDCLVTVSAKQSSQSSQSSSRRDGKKPKQPNPHRYIAGGLYHQSGTMNPAPSGSQVGVEPGPLSAIGCRQNRTNNRACGYHVTNKSRFFAFGSRRVVQTAEERLRRMSLVTIRVRVLLFLTCCISG